MRSVADRLGVGAMSLYRYVPGKTELLELMLDAVHAEDSRCRRRRRLARPARMARAPQPRADPAPSVDAPGRRSGSARRSARTSSPTSTPTCRRSAASACTPQEMIAAAELVGNYVQGATRAAVEAEQIERASGQSDEQWWQRAPVVLGRLLRPRALPGDLRGLTPRAATTTPLDALRVRPSADPGRDRGAARRAAERGTPRAGARTRSARPSRRIPSFSSTCSEATFAGSASATTSSIPSSPNAHRQPRAPAASVAYPRPHHAAPSV